MEEHSMEKPGRSTQTVLKGCQNNQYITCELA